MSDSDGLICAFVLDGKGGGRPVDWPEIASWTPQDGVLWIHLDRSGDDTLRWLTEESGIDGIIAEALLQSESRPRVLSQGGSLLVALRGVNLNPGADPEDMVSLRVWLEADRVVTVRRRRLMAVNDLREAIERGNGPRDPGECLVGIAGGLIERMAPIIAEIEDRVDRLEDEVLTAHSAELRSQLAEVRRNAIALRRYLAPQRDTMTRLPSEQAGWLGPDHRAHLREIADRTLRYVEDLDTVRERATVVQDELNNRLSDQMNRTMYVLTVVAAVLLPPSLLTGLLGINVGGMPGVESPLAFSLVALTLVALGAIEIVVLRKLKWI